MSHEDPLTILRRLSERGATGEMNSAVDDLEVHVFLQEGRVAWATSSAARFAFSRDLVRRCNLEPDALREIVEDCRRSRRPLGETLIAWGLATRDDVRAALRLQIEGALETLIDRPNAPTLFLPRGARAFAYDPSLTFALGDVLAAREAAPLSRSGGLEAAFLDRLLAEVPDLRWGQVLARREGRRPEVLEVRPAGAAVRRSTLRVAELAFDGAIDVVVVRAGLGTMVGVARDEATSIWLGLGREARLGTVFAAISGIVSGPAATRSEPPLSGPATISVTRCEGCSPVLEDVLSRWSDAEAACVSAAGEITIVHRPGIDPMTIREIAVSRTAILDVDEVLDDTCESGETDLAAFGKSARSLVLGHGARWHLGAPVLDGSGRVLWLTVARSGSQGLAWALLGATARQLAQAPCGARRC